MQLVATPDTDLLLIMTLLCSGTHYSISFSHMSVELVQFVSQLLNLVMFIQIFTHVKLLKINPADSERTFIFLLTLHSWQFLC